ncbi:MAG TPA: YSC84-related protein [Gammaproteobacteria bacterium]|nr:YSC84-related protein [Gammaproteobacteria bacterium]
MKRVNGAYPALAAAMALACGAAWGQHRDEDRVASADHSAAEHSDRGHENVAEQRHAIEQMAMKTIDELKMKRPDAAKLLDDAYGYAVFDTTKGGLIVTGAGGTGVAMKKGGGRETFMHVGGAGVGLGAGLENYKLVLLFQDKQVFDQFVNGEWNASASAQAAAGREGKAAEANWENGVAIFRMTDAGLIAQADVSGMKFWVSDKLNTKG